MPNDKRFQLLENWIKNTLKWEEASIEVASADASFRRYFRIKHHHKTFVAMDAPPDKEDTQTFIDVTQRLLASGVHAPQIIAKQTELGFLMLEDLGTVPYQNVLNTNSADDLYTDALQTLITLQQANTDGLPSYSSALLLDEMKLMPVWFLGKHLNIELTPSQTDIITRTFDRLTNAIEKQPTGFVHRDYHSRNLMKTAHHNPGIIDYQDAVSGPLTYDLVSLLRDCYIVWPQSKVYQWAVQYKSMAVKHGLIEDIATEGFLRHMDLMGLQRHIKVLGIFCRLKHRDGKEHYLKDLPLTLSYLLNVGRQHPETIALINLFDELTIAELIGTVAIPA